MEVKLFQNVCDVFKFTSCSIGGVISLFFFLFLIDRSNQLNDNNKIKMRLIFEILK